MKSYFAKLAARATLTNAPAPSQVSARNTLDPFADTVASPNVAAGASLSSTDRFQEPSRRVAPSESLSRTIELRSQTDSTPAQSHKRSPSVAPPVNERPRSIKEARPLSERRAMGHDADDHKITFVESQDVDVTSRTKPHQLSAEPERSAHQTAPTNLKKSESSQPLDDSEVNDRLSTVEKEQMILLRKADTFMAGLFARRSTQEPESEETAKENQVRPRESKSLAQPPTRLKPTPTPAQVSEPAEEEPSLVIERLSVEVVPPAAPVMTPQRQVVVIGGGRRTSAEMPSAHRFGFSRY